MLLPIRSPPDAARYSEALSHLLIADQATSVSVAHDCRHQRRLSGKPLSLSTRRIVLGALRRCVASAALSVVVRTLGTH